MSKEFVPVADEVYYLYPENPDHLRRAASRPDHQFFRMFGEQMPPGAWNARGTKQGIYMIGPDGEYLEGRFAASGEPEDIRARLQRALSRWEQLKRDRGYANRPVPARPWTPPPGYDGEVVFRVNLRDLPRAEGDRSGARRHEISPNGMWLDFVRWAWNENWTAIPTARSLVPKGSEPEEVDPALVQRIAREVIVDNVRGQAPTWRPNEVQKATMTMRRSGSRIVYTGEFSMASGGRGFDGKLYGEGVWSDGKFTDLDWVVIGTRRGAGPFNQRERDLGPAPMGISFSLRRQ